MTYKLEQFNHICYYHGVNTIGVVETTQGGKRYVDLFCFFPLKKKSAKGKIKAV